MLNCIRYSQDWKLLYDEASLSEINRDKKLEQVEELIEKVCWIPSPRQLLVIDTQIELHLAGSNSC